MQSLCIIFKVKHKYRYAGRCSTATNRGREKSEMLLSQAYKSTKAVRAFVATPKDARITPSSGFEQRVDEVMQNMSKRKKVKRLRVKPTIQDLYKNVLADSHSPQKIK